MMGGRKLWRAVAAAPSQGHLLVIASPMVLTLAGMGVLSSVPEDSLPVLRVDFGERGGVPCAIGEALSHRGTIATARARAMAWESSHVSPRGPSLD